MSINYKVQTADYTPEYLRSVADEANRWRVEVADVMQLALKSAQAGHYACDFSRDITPMAKKELYSKGFTVHNNSRTVSWQ